MPTSNSKVICRVNRRRPCRICEKPDWRSYVRDGERISICMCVSDGARKINRRGGAIFIHDDWREEKGIEVRVAADIPQSPIAPVKVRAFVYGRLIELSPAALYPGALAVVDRLMSKGEDNLTPEETTLLELLVQLIERFEEKAYPIPESPGYRVLQTSMENRGVKQADLLLSPS
jgi:hypothetical protein